jgi:hypothetical protein
VGDGFAFILIDAGFGEDGEAAVAGQFQGADLFLQKDVVHGPLVGSGKREAKEGGGEPLHTLPL